MKTLLYRFLGIGLLSFPGAVLAANFNNPIEGQYQGIYGNAITLEVPSTVSKSPVSGENQAGDVSFQIKPDTIYRNFSQLSDLQRGDEVRVNYYENSKMKARVANSITKLGAGQVVNSQQTQVIAPSGNQAVTTTTTTTSKMNP
jgi:hypothetical protein